MGRRPKNITKDKDKEKSGRKKITQTDTLPDGTLIDLDSYDWGENKLSKKEKLFIVWYCLPDQIGFQNPTKAAMKAGYSTVSAYQASAKIITNPKIKEIVDKFINTNIKVSIRDAANQIMAQKIARSRYDVADFYRTTEIGTENGGAIRKTAIIPIDEIDPEKRKLIDGVDFNNAGIPSYRLPNRERESADILKLNEQLNQQKSTGDYDVQTTVNVIKNNLETVKTTIRVTNEKIRNNAVDYMENSENQPDYD